MSRITAPTLIIWGAKDMAPLTYGQKMIGEFRSGTLEVLPVGHFPFLEAPAETANLIQRFVAR